MTSLATLWERLYWSVPERGPLLLVGGEQHAATSPVMPFDPFGHWGDGAELDAVAIAAPPRRGYNLATLLPVFDCSVQRFGELSAIVRNNVIAFDPPKRLSDLPKTRSEAQQEAAFLSLLVSLTSGQLQQAGTTQGLPPSSLSPPQRKLLTESLPEFLYLFFPTGDETSTTLPTKPLTGFTLRLQRTLQLDEFHIGSLSPTSDSAPEIPWYRPKRNQPRPLGLDLAHPALRVLVPLPKPGTLTQLVAHLAAVTRLPLVADARLETLTVQVRGTRVRAGDLLEALCRSVGGTVRTITEGSERVYLLTEDTASLAEQAQRVAPLWEALEKENALAEALRKAQVEAARKALRQRPDWARLPRGTGAELPDALWNAPRQGIPFASAPPALQKEYQSIAEAFRQGVEEAQKREGAAEYLNDLGGTWDDLLFQIPTQLKAFRGISAEVYLLRSAERAELFEGLNLFATLLEEDEPPKPLRFPATWQVRALFTRLPSDDTPETELVARAKALGFTELWVFVPVGPEAGSGVAALAKACQAAGIGLMPVICPLTALSATTPRARSLLGQTARESRQEEVAALELTTPESVDLPALIGRLRHLASLHGTSKLALWPRRIPGLESELVWSSRPDAWAMGGLPGQRLALVRRDGVDPCDLDDTPDGKTIGWMRAYNHWYEQQEKRQSGFLSRLQAALTSAHLPLPVWIADDKGDWGPWRSKSVVRHPLAVRLKTIDYDEPYAAHLASYIEPGRSYPRFKVSGPGVVVALHTLPLEEALELLEPCLRKL